MARQRKTYSTNFTFILIAGVSVLAVAIYIVITLNSKSEYERLTAFPTQSYLDGDALWNNAEYRIKGSFQNILVQKKGGGSLLCSVVEDDKKLPLPVILTTNACKVPLEPDQKIYLKVKIRDDGAIVATDCVPQ